jgi:hypothetical protein
MIEISRLVGYILTVTSFTLLITSIFVTQIQLAYTQANMNNTTNSKDIQNNLLITNIMAKNLENRIQKAGAILEITGKLPQVRDVPYANLLNQTLNTLHGISENSDVDKRKIAQDILSNDKDFGAIFFLMANGDVYLVEPYKRQLNLTTNNLSFRDYYKGAVNTGGTYLGNVIKSASTGLPQVNIATPVFAEDSMLTSNKTLVGIWGGGLNLTAFSEPLQALNLTNGLRIVYVDQFGQKIVDSDINKSTISESFANLNSFKNATSGQAGSTIDRVNNTKMLVTYQPVKVFSNTWAVILMQPPPLP